MNLYQKTYLSVDELVEEAVDVKKELEDIGLGNAAQLVVYNDDVNSFDWVIESFVDVLRHTADQAEQLAHLIHFKGRAVVKTASKKTLKPLKDALCDRTLSAVIEGGDEE
jgi:ATP-dependent Clp protease adaptor protein ClpS